MKTVRVNARSVAIVAVAAGLATLTARLDPTGGHLWDAILVACVVAVVVWASASAPWWIGAAIAGSAAIFGVGPIPVVLGVVGCLLGLWVGSVQADRSVLRAVVGALGVNALAWSQLTGFFGASAVIGVSLAVVLFVAGVARRHAVVRRRVVNVALLLAGCVLLAVAGLAFAAMRARSDLYSAQRKSLTAVSQLAKGQQDEAALLFSEASADLSAVQDTVSSWYAAPSSLLPIAAQHRHAVIEIAERSAAATAELANLSLLLDPQGLRVDSGRINVAALQELTPPIDSTADSLVDLRATIDRVSSPWLIPQVAAQLDKVAAQYDDNASTLELGRKVLGVAPQMFGADGKRSYLLVFTTPAEARGMGGFMGNYGVLTVDNGQIALSAFGRTNQLNVALGGGVVVNGPQDWENMWGDFGFVGPDDGKSLRDLWSSITLSPHFPSTATVMADLFPRSGGQQVDGVIGVDPYVLQALVGLSGGVTVQVPDAEPVQLTPENTAKFLIYDQYALADQATRVEMLAQVSGAVFQKVLSGALPGPTALARELRPVVDERRLVVWMADETEQGIMETLGLDGGIPDRARSDGFHFIVNNAGANKLDAYLTRSFKYRAQVDETTGAIFGTIDVTLTNNGPSEGLPKGVIGNYTDDPPGTNRMWITMYSTVPVASVSDGSGTPVHFNRRSEAGWNTASSYVALASGETRTFSYVVAGVLGATDEAPGSTPDENGEADEADASAAASPPDEADGYELIVVTQPLATSATYDITVTDTAGTALVTKEGVLGGLQRLRPSSSPPDTPATTTTAPLSK